MSGQFAIILVMLYVQRASYVPFDFNFFIWDNTIRHPHKIRTTLDCFFFKYFKGFPLFSLFDCKYVFVSLLDCNYIFVSRKSIWNEERSRITVKHGIGFVAAVDFEASDLSKEKFEADSIWELSNMINNDTQAMIGEGSVNRDENYNN